MQLLRRFTVYFVSGANNILFDWSVAIRLNDATSQAMPTSIHYKQLKESAASVTSHAVMKKRSSLRFMDKHMQRLKIRPKLAKDYADYRFCLY